MIAFLLIGIPVLTLIFLELVARVEERLNREDN